MKDELKNIVCETGLGAMKRDQTIKDEETSGSIIFHVIKDRSSDQNLIWLSNLKTVISRQLPKMPKEYIVRLVFDRFHESIIVTRENRVIGGVCYRPNREERFIEIAFLAISSTEQVKGFGTRLMNKLKEYCKNEGFDYMLTYADNNAIGYFAKQGFAKAIRLEEKVWKKLKFN